eukprot:766145-Hanusia_phi.AAC.6
MDVKCSIHVTDMNPLDCGPQEHRSTGPGPSLHSSLPVFLLPPVFLYSLPFLTVMHFSESSWSKPTSESAFIRMCLLPEYPLLLFFVALLHSALPANTLRVQ